MPDKKTIILGGGVTGLATGLASALPIYEMAASPGGICASYYMRPGSSERLCCAPRDGEAYRFEIGGGHWMWGGDPLVLRFLHSLATFKSYARSAAVYLPEQGIVVPYPIQNHLSYLGSTTARQALCEMVETSSLKLGATATMANWMHTYFGPTLCRIFFDPFHRLYTAGLWEQLGPQDESKSPVDLPTAIQGSFNSGPKPAGYNAFFQYPTEGLNFLVQRMANRCNIHYSKRVTRISLDEKIVHFDDDDESQFESLLCTLPLNKTLQLASVKVDHQPDPYTSVTVLNIGARKGPTCPTQHWLYIPENKGGFHRVGFYSHVDPITPALVSLSVSPANASVEVGQSQQFSAVVSNTTNTAVNWLVSGILGGNSSVGTITTTGLYTAPSTAPGGSVAVTARSSTYPTDSASAIVTITQPPTHYVSLAWSPVPSVAGYNVYRSAQATGPFTRINSSVETATVYADNSVTSGQTYYYATTAVSSTGTESPYSNIAQAMIP